MQAMPSTRLFPCEHCHAAIQIPALLPPTTAPCPHCGKATTSPALKEAPQKEPAVPESKRDPEPPRAISTKSTKRKPADEKSSGAGLFWLLVALLFLAIGAVAIYLVGEMKADRPRPTKKAGTSAEAPPDLTEESFGIGGLEVLEDFFEAETAEEKSMSVLGGENLLPELRAYYSLEDSRANLDANGKLRVEQLIELSPEKETSDRGIYLFDFYQPRQDKQGRQITSKIEGPDSSTPAPARVLFKEIDGQLRFDWNTFVQTKDRTLRDFVRSPKPGVRKIFRTFVSEEDTAIENEDQTHRRYRFADPAHWREDFAVIRVAKKSGFGKILESIAWTDKPGKDKTERTMTLELKWSEDEPPELGIINIFCWEFLGVDGDPSNLNLAE